MVNHIILGPTAAAAQLPIIGDDLAQIGRSISYMVNCKPGSADLYFKAAWNALPILLIGALKPEMWDINIGGNRHRNRRGRGLRFWFTQLLNGVFTDVEVPGWTIFRWAEALQRVGYYLMVLDATSDFLINWTSMVYQWNGCDLVPTAPWWLATNPGAASFFTCDGDWHTALGIGWDDGLATGPSPSPGRLRILQNCYPRHSLTFSPTVWASTPEAHLTGVRIRHSGALGIVGEWAPPNNGQANTDGLYVVEPFGEALAGTDFWLEYQGNGGFMGLDILEWYMWSANELPDAPLGPDP